ncbi:hypothetical protein BHE74_00055893 [Ensete ventricosum]|nr:hypothetical protein BHE74_00055893 [Ensete ventricosum]RZS27735.1 hypothetical protein BHM03_00061258 [Ensete ventricosum]
MAIGEHHRSCARPPGPQVAAPIGALGHRRPPLLATALAASNCPLQPGRPYKGYGCGRLPLPIVLAACDRPYRWPGRGWQPLQATCSWVVAPTSGLPIGGCPHPHCLRCES